MSISFSGLASGLDTASWVEALVSVKQSKVTTLQNQLSALQSQKHTISDTKNIFNTFRTALEKFTDKKFGGTFDMFGKNSAVSSNESVFTATAGAGAVRQNYDIFVEQLATQTKATSKESASKVADDTTKLSELGITNGTFTVYSDGVKTSLEITDETTLKDLKDGLEKAGITAQVNEQGFLELSSAEGKTVSAGATNDTSNIISLLGITKQDNGSYKSANAMFKASTASVLTDENAGFKQTITQGTFKIGDAEFTIDENTTLSSLISEINGNKDAQAYAYWDDATGKLSITSTKEGASYINIEAGTSNFTDVMGFTETQWAEDGSVQSSKMLVDTQELGQNAKFTINGTSITSTSNTVTADVSRIEGVTITLKGVSKDEDGNATLSVSQDTDELLEAAKSFVQAYNDTIAKIETVTANGADLQRDSSLRSLKSTLRNYAIGVNSSNGGAYNLLSQIGITNGKADSTNLSTEVDYLELDEEAFRKALEEDPASLEAILAGENGVLSLMESSVEQALSATTGYFDVKNKSVDSEISRMRDKISRQQSNIATYRAQLEKKFSQMELIISQMQQNYSSFLQ